MVHRCFVHRSPFRQCSFHHRLRQTPASSNAVQLLHFQPVLYGLPARLHCTTGQLHYEPVRILAVGQQSLHSLAVLQHGNWGRSTLRSSSHLAESPVGRELSRPLQKSSQLEADELCDCGHVDYCAFARGTGSNDWQDVFTA
ncbi:hypothetical protein RvY_14309-2 [Ramazzottius varieornatus]|uniref:Uncharacterized protein n=1 Tax=Ramazzottius varieornatus TaxID=947166 RepID=A0A1D1VY54_RAMVA|nr:hypothetical protein RvY_14309-2 [Ramazzottius varieornatus]